MKPILVLMMTFCLALIASEGITAESEGFDDFGELDLENLLGQVVTTASRHEQTLAETPVSTTVLTAEDIHRSGATNIPDVLRQVPGLDVTATTMSGVNVTARGMNELSANTMLVLVDGRSVYAEFYGIILWDYLPISIDEIEKIEVTKSPGSALYGANAFAGVINIITRGPQEGPYAAVRTTAAEYGSAIANFVHGDRRGRLSYKVSGGWSRVDDWDRPTDDVGNLPRVNGLARWEVDDGSSWSFSAGRAEGRTRNVSSNLAGAMGVDGSSGYARADYEKGAWHLRGYWNTIQLNLDPEESFSFDAETGLRTDNFDFELQHSVRVADDHLLIWGTSYRRNYIDWSVLDVDYTQDLFAGSVYDEWRALEPLTLALGLRYDHHPLVKSHVSPRGSAVFRPNDRHTLRASIGRAHRNPTYLESYFRTTADIAELPGYPIDLEGNLDLVSEQITSYELGYQGQVAAGLVGTVDLYYNRIRDLVDLGVSETYAAPPAPFPGIPRTVSFLNLGNLDALGGEIAMDWRFNARLGARASYAFVDLSDPESAERFERAPRHKMNLGVGVGVTRDFRLDLLGRYVGATRWTYLEGGQFTSSEAGDFFTLDARAAYSFSPTRLELAVGGRNILDHRYREYPVGMEFRSQVYATVNVRF